MKKTLGIVMIAAAAIIICLALGVLAFGQGRRMIANATATVEIAIERTGTADMAQQADDNATATAQAAEEQATQAAEATTEASNEQAENMTATIDAAQAADITATAIAPIMADLEQYGVSTTDGAVGWIHPSFKLLVVGFLQSKYENEFIRLPLTDFVISSDITWDTETGAAGCGFILRSNGDFGAPSQYVVLITRAGNGSVLYSKQSKGNQTYSESYPAGGFDSQFQWQNDATNRLAVVAQGNQLSVYTNGTKIADIVDKSYQSGVVAMTALSESGKTSCAFDNTWLWIIR